MLSCYGQRLYDCYEKKKHLLGTCTAGYFKQLTKSFSQATLVFTKNTDVVLYPCECWQDFFQGDLVLLSTVSSYTSDTSDSLFNETETWTFIIRWIVYQRYCAFNTIMKIRKLLSKCLIPLCPQVVLSIPHVYIKSSHCLDIWKAYLE